MEQCWICMEIGGTNLRYGAVDAGLRLLEFHKSPTRELSDAPDKVSYLAGLLLGLIERIGRGRVLGVSMALASLMDRERTTIYSSPMVRGFENIPLVEALGARLGLPVVMEKDVNILLLYEINRLALPREGIVAGVFIGTGLGNAICIDGKVYKGANGAACELGHIPVRGLNAPCGCGKKGCIELLACGRVLQRLAAETYGCPITELFIKHGQEEPVRQIVYDFALAIATEICILDPVCVVLGGGVVEMEGFPLEYLRESIAQNLRTPNPREALRIIPASGDEHAGVVGAAIHAMQQPMAKAVPLPKGME